jgi:hypothetical protein
MASTSRRYNLGRVRGESWKIQGSTKRSGSSVWFCKILRPLHAMAMGSMLAIHSSDILALQGINVSKSKLFQWLLTSTQAGDSFDGSIRYDEANFGEIAKAVSNALASLLPTTSIIALYYINDNLHRLIFILIFSAVFTVCLSIFTAATRVEIFLASIGLASIQAVFVGNFLGASYQSGSAKAP